MATQSSAKFSSSLDIFDIVPTSDDTDMEDTDSLGAEPVLQVRAHGVDHQELNATIASSSLPRQEGIGADTNRTGSAKQRFIIAIDFGTTFSTVAFVSFKEGTPLAEISQTEIKCVDHYPDISSGDHASVLATYEEVPSELWYPDEAMQKNETTTVGRRDVSTDQIPALPEPFAASCDDEDRHSYPWLYDDDDDAAAATAAAARARKPVTNRRGNGHGPQSSNPVWGYAVQRQLGEPDIIFDKTRHVTRFKLMLDSESPHTQNIRQQLSETIKTLRSAKILTHPIDIIASYLEQLMKHTKALLEKDHGLTEACPIEFVLCVPTMWTEKACRDMETAMAKAIRASGLGKLCDESIEDLFIVSEPEAAAAQVIAQTSGIHIINPGDTFVLIDAGGGTVDVITYTVKNTNPLRLEAEAVPPDGACCGSSFLNQNFRALLQERVRSAEYLYEDIKVDNIIDSCVIRWENGAKRNIDVTKDLQPDSVYFPGLKANAKRGFNNNRLLLSPVEMKKVFRDCLDGVVELLKKQLKMSATKGLVVSKVILVGGFGESPSLRSKISEFLVKERNIVGLSIKAVFPSITTTAVARGAVLRALRKEEGPARITRSSYGLLRTEHWDPSEYPQDRKRKRPDPDSVDGQLHVKDTIRWVILKNETLSPKREFLVKADHRFKPGQKRWICEEVLFVSDKWHKSHYGRRHRENKGAEIAGHIVVDMSDLNKDGKYPLSKHDNPETKRTYWFYEVAFNLVMIIDGRNLRFEARLVAEPGKVVQSKQISIAAAFVPGTE